LVEKRQVESNVILNSIQNASNITLSKLNEEYQTIIKIQTSFSYFAIITFIFVIITIVSVDSWRLYSFLKLNKNKILKSAEYKAFEEEKNCVVGGGGMGEPAKIVMTCLHNPILSLSLSHPFSPFPSPLQCCGSRYVRIRD
jgi:hypothetical protein